VAQVNHKMRAWHDATDDPARPRPGRCHWSPCGDTSRTGQTMTSGPSTRYGAQAQAHWARWRPWELAQIPDPEAFFAELGEQVERQVDQMASDLAGQDVPGESYLAKVGRLRMARFDAEAQVLRELVLLPPQEPPAPTTAAAAAAAMSSSRTWAPDNTPQAGWLPTVLTPDHPRYSELDQDPGLQKT